MAFRFDDLVETGEIDCTRRYAIHGWIKLRGHEAPLRLQLTGRPGPDLQGRRFRFESRQQTVDPDASTDALEGIIWEQIGPPGDFTASHRVRIVDDPIRELLQKADLNDEPPEIEWKRCLYLEWFSQNGRVVVQLADPLIEFLDSENGTDTVEETPDLLATGADPKASTESSSTETIDEGDFCFEQREQAADVLAADADEPDLEDEVEAASSEPEEEDPWGLFPAGLLRDFDEQALETDRQIREEEDAVASGEEDDLFETVFEQGEGEPLATLLGDDLPLPAHDELTDEQVEGALHVLLARLALLGIALDMCEHATPRSAYRYLVEEIIPEELGHRELLHTQWVQHFSTWEGCADCAREFEEEWKQRHPDGSESEQGTASDTPPEAG